ncbi:MAG: hypothetical protein NC421_02005 [Lachnospiraceae bacterium]|nr:hypothetical protein [Lachnospiraceae bacterium]
MKRALLIFISLMSCIVLYAQGYIIYLTDGTHQVFSAENTGKIEFFNAREIKDNGHEYVDLGLDCGLGWATMNVGASNVEESGEYYAYGETQPKKHYDWDNYKWCNGSEITINKYGAGVDGILELYPEDDVVKTEWGGDWRMPTWNELSELKEKCVVTSIKQNGVSGYQVKGPNGNTIFIPAAGKFDRTCTNLPRYKGENAYLRSSTLYSSSAENARVVYWSSYRSSGTKNFRSTGHTVRGVIPLPVPYIVIYDKTGRIIYEVAQSKIKTINYLNLNKTVYSVQGHDCVDLGLPSDLKWATMNIGASSKSECGNYFAWGEVSSKTDFSWTNYELCRGAYDSLIKYNKNDKKLTLESVNDAASQLWGDKWRLPTKEDVQELIEYCNFELNYIEGKPIYRCEGPNGQYIYIPLSGYAYGNEITASGENVMLYTASRAVDNIEDVVHMAFILKINSADGNPMVSRIGRSYGINIRPVAACQ